MDTPLVLIVEDDENSRVLQETLLTSQGAEILSASNGLEAWNLLQEPFAGPDHFGHPYAEDGRVYLVPQVQGE